MHKRIETFFEIASLADSETGEIGPEANSFGFNSFTDWQEAMEVELNWIKENAQLVQLNLAPLRETWPKCCEALEAVLEYS